MCSYLEEEARRRGITPEELENIWREQAARQDEKEKAAEKERERNGYFHYSDDGLMHFAKSKGLSQILTTIYVVVGWLIFFSAMILSLFYPKDEQTSAPNESSSYVAPSYIEETFRVAGVTFSNEDGENRQIILEKLFNQYGKHEPISAYLESYLYNGDPAFYVFADGHCIGNIPKEEVSHISDAFPDIEDAIVYVSRFEPEGEIIYYATVSVRSKE